MALLIRSRPSGVRPSPQWFSSPRMTPHFSAGAQFTLRDAIRLMIVYSDNTATNLVIDQVGLPATAELMEHLGLPQTKLHSKVYRRESSIFPERSQEFGLGSTTAAEMLTLLEKLHRRELVSPAACEAMLDHLSACDDKLKFRRFLPKAKIAHKTGSLNAIRTDAGLIDSPAGPLAVCVLTRGNKDQSWGEENAAEILCGRIAQEAYRHFNPDGEPQTSESAGPLKLGAAGPLVEGLQRTLNAQMNPSPQLSVDGDFGPATEAAVMGVAGALILFNSARMPGFPPISTPLVVATGLTLAASFFAVITFAIHARHVPIRTGRESLPGQTGTARSEINPRGTGVHARGNCWQSMASG